MKDLIVVALFACWGLFWCSTNTNAAETARVLGANGMHNVKPGGHGWFACSTGDWSSTKFTATGVNGQTVSGVVCCGLLFKSCTVRF